MIAIIDYGAGNVASVANAVTRLGCPFKITSDINDLTNAEKIIFPGVGEASFAVKRLQESGLILFLQQTKKPMLGICLGMQLMCIHSEEGNVDGLNIFPVNVVRFNSSDTKVPHIGWNTVQYNPKNKLFSGIKQDEFFYFANSYYVPLDNSTTSITENKITFSASLAKDNFFGVQFHPEKSSEAGLKVLQNFIDY
ncbi:MAG: imidazole glycerol phosphate synthase subunit HisH [Ignavibacteriaceae bacterium]|nr:imidazole glycerol phosphate synthase subunit HisH [Ignavibacteriaceae bacterium]